MTHPILEEKKSFNENFVEEMAPKGKQMIVQVEVEDKVITLESVAEATAYFTGLKRAMEFTGIYIDFYNKNELVYCSTGEVFAKIRYFTET